MRRKSFLTRAPFGVASKRFESIGFHPGLDPLGTMSKNRSNVGPGDYDLERPPKQTGSGWKCKVETEEFSKNLGFRNAEVLEERRFRRTCGGPGCYDIPDSVFARQSASCKKNVSFGVRARFPRESRAIIPPPGTYNVSTPPERRQFSARPSFERDGFVNRFKSADKPWTKPPNLYTPVDRGSLRALMDKVVSKRGPYDLFTGPRDDSTIKNHFAPPTFKGPINFFNVYPAELDVFLNHPRNQTRGRFLNEKRFGIATMRHMIDDPTQVRRDPDDPSPCTYDISRPRVWRKSLHPFNQSVTYARPPIPWRIFPGVGRYNPKHGTCPKSKRQSWVFKSKTGRTEYKAVEYNSF
ncbi:lymphocyte expansion molecule-like [Photinus pyralis]|uniref:lymphocyte expansion molecule-like n=1 Tax=Photinus pyralis TaxID=7054 RepID=UPI001267704D|nr:lymphocyte expansion molecule-like [Photinus pyralis]